MKPLPLLLAFLRCKTFLGDPDAADSAAASAVDAPALAAAVPAAASVWLLPLLPLRSILLLCTVADAPPAAVDDEDAADVDASIFP